jgi:ABC-type uncharacterized transport system involved in gliding motility auxiliary subunit
MQRILGFLGWVGTALVFAAVAIRFLKPDWNQYGTWSAYAGLALVVLYTLGQWREILAYFRRRQAKYGAMATVGVLVGLAIAIAVNYLSARQNKRWDLTANRQYSLSEQTLKVLGSLQSPVKFTVFDRATEFDRFRNRLDEYSYNSKQVAVEYVDPDTKPVIAKAAKIEQYGTVVVEYKCPPGFPEPSPADCKRELVTSDTEQDLTNGLIKAMSTKEQKVYYLQGHGEKEPNKTERDGFSAVSAILRRDNYMVERLVLAQLKDVPADATVILVAGPTSDILPAEADMLRKYLARGGKMMFMLDPVFGQQSAPPLTNIQSIIKEWGIDVGNNVVVDVSGATNEPSIAVAATYPQHAITERFATLTIYPIARSVDPVMGAAHTSTSFVETSRQSWAETNLGSLTGGAGVALNEESGDKRGPISLAAAVSAPVEAAAGASTNANVQKPETRIVVFGDSDFASNAYAGVPGNQNLFANAISWLAQQEGLIAVRPTQADDRRVSMTPRQQTAAFLTSIFILPGAVFLAGVYTWWRRR